MIEDIDIASYADENTPYVSANSTNRFVKSLKEASTKLYKWFSDNLMKSNANKCHLLVSINNATSSICKVFFLVVKKIKSLKLV